MQKILSLMALFTIVGCAAQNTPDCPYTGEKTGKKVAAPSAGCFSVNQGRLLLIQERSGKVSIPGGANENGESAQCTAFRETWEETGLTLQPQGLIKVFDNGFHLYRCDKNEHSGSINPPARMEVRDAFYLPPDKWDNYEWRFPKQRVLFEELLKESL